MNWTKSAPSTTICWPALQAGGNVILIADARAQRHALPREAAIALRDIDKGQIFIVAQDRRNRHQQCRCFPGGRGCAPGHTSAFSGNRRDCSTTTRTATERVLGSTSAAILSTVPESVVRAVPVITSAMSPTCTEARSESKICAITQTRERSATVKAGVVPACSNWPGVISLFHHRAGDGRADHAFDAWRWICRPRYP